MKLDPSKLHEVCRPCTFTNPTENLRLAQSLIQCMFAESGIGLAANQCGHSVRLFVMFVEREIFHCFNPEVVAVGEESETVDEGCLSYPGQSCSVDRPVRITARFANARGQYQEREFTGLAARCYLHELDHLDGRTMWDRQVGVNSAVEGDPYKIEVIGSNPVLPTKLTVD